MTRRSTLKDVARRAGVSVATASYVVNGRDRRLRDETRVRVLEAVAALRYEPSALARSLRTGESRAVGMLIPSIANPMNTPIVRGVEDVARQHGYGVIVASTDEDPAAEAAYLQVLWQSQVTKLVVIPSGQGRREILALRDQGASVVIANRVAGYESCASVAIDNAAGAYAATVHLLALGHRRIALVPGPADVSTSLERLDGYRRALTEWNVVVDADLIRTGPYHEQTGCEQMGRLLELADRPTAVFLGGAPIWLGALKRLKRERVHIPEELAVIGYGQADWAELVDPPLTMIRPPLLEVGRRAGELLFEGAAESAERSAPKQLWLQPELVVRESTGVRNGAEYAPPRFRRQSSQSHWGRT